MSDPTIVEFDLDRYLRNSKKVDLRGIEWAQVPDHPLSDGDVMCLHYMMDIWPLALRPTRRSRRS
ncbi:MAG: hypothetical protein E6G48_04995 [Actinobacteria bacterium]|nr:MAG: hypothetical protein E6G48_04995 [Actinomycetota bacterium]